MSQVFRDVEQWLGQRPLWLQDAAYRHLNNDSLTAEDYQDLTELCKKEAQISISEKNYSRISSGSLSVKDEPANLRLESINSIKGISALSPKNPLKLNKHLTIIYGQNGSGKSSYVRLLKHISGSKKPGVLMGNVYSKEQHSQECSITISRNEEKSELLWNPAMGVIDELRNLQLYDTNCANIYVNDENEVAYEPWLLQFFSKLTNTCQEVSKLLKEELEKISLLEFKYPIDYSNTNSILWLRGISKSTLAQEVETSCEWAIEDEEKLNQKRRQLNEPVPLAKAQQFKQVSSRIKSLHNLLDGVKKSLDVEACLDIINAKVDCERKKHAAEKDANAIFENLPLQGVHSESWKLLWEQARIFSEKHAYPNESFPNVSEDAHCVLCQQPLTSPARERITSFENYVKAALNTQAKEAEDHLATLLKKVMDIPTLETLELYFNSIGAMSELDKQGVIDFCTVLQLRKKSLFSANSIDEVTCLPSEDIIFSLNESVLANDEQAVTYSELSKADNKDVIKNYVTSLEARKWLHLNKASIADNIEKLKKINKYEQAITLTKTQALSSKKSSLTDQLITTEYVKRFQNELKELGGIRINVELIKTRAQKGQIYHQIRLKECPPSVRAADVLSEGEFRIVSLAGFLADVEGGLDSAPFIFDDPISSLDQVFEEATVKRIAKLSTTRQVIVFTHRLSFLTLLEQAAKESDVEYDVTWLRSESWGSGEPGETPIFAKRPDRALNQLLTERLPKASRILQEQGRTEYDLIAKGLCSDFRVLIERIVENDLLSDVVQRFRRSVNTLGKIHKLAHISAEDCQMIEDYMTKYSTYEHSQANETPIMLPEPDELKADMEKLKSWLDVFKKRVGA